MLLLPHPLNRAFFSFRPFFRSNFHSSLLYFPFSFRRMLRNHGAQLLGTSMSWFLLDVAFYSQNLFQKDVFTASGFVPPANRMSALEETSALAR